MLCSGTASAADNDREEVEHAARHFLANFENLDLPAFIDCFADDATVFFPAPEPPERVNGKAAIRARFEQVFAGIRQGASGGPPYHRLEAQDLQIQMVGSDAAIVSFHLRNTERIARRTLVLHRTRGTWLIVHLHASTFQRKGD